MGLRAFLDRLFGRAPPVPDDAIDPEDRARAAAFAEECARLRGGPERTRVVEVHARLLVARAAVLRELRAPPAPRPTSTEQDLAEARRRAPDADPVVRDSLLVDTDPVTRDLDAWRTAADRLDTLGAHLTRLEGEVARLDGKDTSGLSALAASLAPLCDWLDHERAPAPAEGVSRR
jgi:hypothetical protein